MIDGALCTLACVRRLFFYLHIDLSLTPDSVLRLVASSAVLADQP